MRAFATFTILTLLLSFIGIRPLSAQAIISEVDPFNTGELADGEGDFPDWLEIENQGSTSLDLSGYFLSDDPSTLSKWQFPTGTVITPAQRYQIVFLSRKTGIAGELHANFRLDSDGEFLALIAPDGLTIVDQFSPSLPPIPRPLSYGRNGTSLGFFTQPSPGAANGTALADFVENVGFSNQRGHYDSPINLTLTPPNSHPGASIRFSLDGSPPSETEGTLYTGPINLSSTTVVKARAFVPGLAPSEVETHSFLFAESTLIQDNSSAQTVGFPPEWEYVNPTSDTISIINTGDYEMDRRVVEDPRYDLISALRSIPTISLSLPSEHLFRSGQRNSQTPPHGLAEEGIYVNPGGQAPGGINRDLFERPASFEYIPAFGETGDRQENCGLRMQGTSSTAPGTYLKLSFRVIFRRIYGSSQLDHNVFPNDPEATTSHNSLVLRAGSSDKWDHQLNDPVFGVDQAQFIRESFVRKMQLATGDGTTTRSDWVHLYLNGIYWGLYNLIERIDEQWLEAYEGGDDEDYLVLSDRSLFGGGQIPSEQEELNNLAINQTGTVLDQVDFEAAAGVMDMEAYATYMLVNHLARTEDWPVANFRASARNGLTRPWQWHSSGADQSLVFDQEDNFFSYRNQQLLNPGSVWYNLSQNPLFREIFADVAHRHLIAEEGALTENRLISLYQRELDQVQIPLAAESARWGDARGTLRTPNDDWLPLVTSVRDSFLPTSRTDLIALYRERSLISRVTAPRISPPAGALSPGDLVTIETPPETTVYYTTDGSDPKTALNYTRSTLLDRNAPWRSLRSVNEPTDWSTQSFDDRSWTPGTGSARIAFGDPQAVELVRYRINIPDQASLSALHSMSLFAESGFAGISLFINGVEIVTDRRTGFNFGNPETIDLTAGVSHLTLGENILGVRLERINQGGPFPVLDGTFTIDMLHQFLLTPGSNEAAGTPSTGTLSAFPGLTRLKARARNNLTGEWSALSEATFDTGLLPTSLVISELHYRPSQPITTEELAITSDRDDFEFIELANIGNSAIDLAEYSFTAGISFSFPAGSTIPAGGRILLVRDPAAFAARYPAVSTPILGTYNGRLSNDGEQITLNSPSGPVQSFTYNDRAPWPEAADGDGPSLVLLAPESAPDHSLPSNWRLSSTPNGNPGTDDALALADWQRDNRISNLNNDPDRDGIPNLLEFITGTDPRRADGPSTLQLQLDEGGEISFNMPLSIAALDDVSLHFEASPDLRTWTEENFERNGETVIGQGRILQNFTFSNSRPSQRKEFYRMRIELR